MSPDFAVNRGKAKSLSGVFVLSERLEQWLSEQKCHVWEDWLGKFVCLETKGLKGFTHALKAQGFTEQRIKCLYH